MVDIALSGYVFAALGFAVLAVLMAINQRREHVGLAAITAAIASSLWAAVLAWQVYSARGFAVSSPIWFAVELARDAGLLTFLIALLHRSAPSVESARRWVRALQGIEAIA